MDSGASWVLAWQIWTKMDLYVRQSGVQLGLTWWTAVDGQMICHPLKTRRRRPPETWEPPPREEFPEAGHCDQRKP